MRARGRPVLGGFAGLFFGVFLGLSLLVFGALALNSLLLVALPAVIVVLGIAWAFWAPLGRRRAPEPRS